MYHVVKKSFVDSVHNVFFLPCAVLFLEFSGDMPDPRINPVNITDYFDVEYTSDLVTRCSVTGALVCVNSTLF